MYLSMKVMEGDKMHLDYLRYIIEVDKTKNISLAAKNLHVSQPNVSQGIKNIENTLGIKLFKRSRSGSIATDAGKQAILIMQEILDRIDELKSISLDESVLLQGNLNITTIASLSMSLIPQTISKLKKQYPKLNIALTEEHSMDIINMVVRDETDLGFIGVPSNVELPQDNLEYTFFRKSKIMALVGSNTTLAEKGTISLSEIIKHPILSTSEFVINELRKHGSPNFLFKSKNLEGAKQVIAEGLAIGFYADISLLFDPYVHTGKVVPLNIEEDNFILSLYSVQRSKKSHLASEKFIQEFNRQLIKLYNT